MKRASVELTIFAANIAIKLDSVPVYIMSQYPGGSLCKCNANHWTDQSKCLKLESW